MRERVTRFISCLFIASSLLVALFPFFVVFADNATYKVIENEYCYISIGSSQYGVDNVSVRSATEVRAIIIADSNNSTGSYYFVKSGSGLSYAQNSNSNSCSASYYTTNRNYSGYWYFSIDGMYLNGNTYNIPVKTGVTNNVQTAIYYTFGAGAIDPEPTPTPGPTWGGPANVMYNTRISGTGQMASQNIDRIVFSPNIDSNGNVLPDNARFQIRAVPLEYSGLTPTDVLSKTYSQAVLNYTDAAVLMDRIPANGVYEVKWSEVAETLSIPFSTINSVIQGDDYFYKMGWIYEIRLQIGDYYSEWVKIYTATSSGAQIEEDISNTDSISQDLIKNITIINSLNNTETVNWYINETEINMQEYNEPGEGQKPWWAYLLEAIIGSFNITNNYISEGTTESQVISNEVNNNKNDLDTQIDSYHAIEHDQITDMNNSLDDIDTNPVIFSSDKFINSANWVSQQYMRITNNTVIGSLIGFSLIFGLALIFLGRYK